ncbi:heterokaryon incompatibility protein-domain-containing protein [Xylaria flabelliformis]|nr:heterokaryon incompatibility protein-domain-containing protein [Xylaria flabelliformis]
MPHEDEKATTQCQIFEYPLQKVGEEAHLYEALSYVWGSEHDRRPICIQSDDIGDNYPTAQMKRGFDIRSCLSTGNNSRLLVTANLHTALSHLRGRLVERILWIDAICINQENKDEKGQQVQLMAKIYARAYRVIVWLGEAPDNNNQALEVIRVAAEEQSTSATINEVNEQAITTLLKRPWFQRIWVLQEVAAAQRVLIKYGPTDIDGYAFCSGLSELNLSYKTSPDFQSLILPAVYLIRGAVSQHKHKRDEINRSSTFSLHIRPLGELVDRYHTRKATNRLDKVYALLDMSSDDPNKTGLIANYNVSWREVFRKLVEFSLSNQMSVDTWDDKEVAVIEGKGYVVGEVYSVDNTQYDRQRMDITWKNTSSMFDPTKIQSPHFTFHASAKPVQKGDIVCLLQGASKLTIVRLCGDFLTIIMIAAPPADYLQKWLTSVTTFPNDLPLVWDWGEDSKYLTFNREVPKCPRTGCQCQEYLDKSARLWNIGMLLNMIKKYENARKNIRNAVEFYMTGVALRSADEAYPDHGPWRKADEEVLRVLDLLSVSIGAKYPKHDQTPLLWVAEQGYEAVVQQLLDKGVDIHAKNSLGQTLLFWAAGNGYEAVVRQLLDKGADINLKDDYGGTPLLHAVQYRHEAVVRQLLDKGAKIDLKDDLSRKTPSPTAEIGREAIVQQLLDKGAGRVLISLSKYGPYY